jgi:hypothetical protein
MEKTWIHPMAFVPWAQIMYMFRVFSGQDKTMSSNQLFTYLISMGLYNNLYSTHLKGNMIKAWL